MNPSGPPATYDVQGAADFPFALDNVLIEYTPVDVGLQMGSWRSVSHSFNVFAVNCFVDELAAAAGLDPLELQLRLLGEQRTAEIDLPLPGRRGRPRPEVGLLRRVLELAADRAGWSTPLPAGRGRGIACCYYKQTYAAHVAEVSVDPEGNVRVHRIVAALDCGRVVNPSGVEAQAEGAAMDGVATVLNWEVTLEGGRVRQSNFHDYPLLTIARAPEVEVHVAPSDRPPSGVGEPPYPSVAPAIANAIFAAAGVRVRRLPVRRDDLRGGSRGGGSRSQLVKQLHLALRRRPPLSAAPIRAQRACLVQIDVFELRCRVIGVDVEQDPNATLETPRHVHFGRSEECDVRPTELPGGPSGILALEIWSDGEDDTCDIGHVDRVRRE